MAALRIASRNSELALAQCHIVGSLLGCDYEIIEVTTSGDIQQDVSLSQVGGQGIFVKEIQVALLNCEADIALHSAKDMPTDTPEGLEVASIPVRGDVRDVLVGARLEDLPYGATVGTGAQRRRAQLAAIRPDLQFKDLRGNIGTRLEKAKDFDAIVLAHAGLARLDKQEHVAEVLPIHVMLPQVAQGALAIETRSDDKTSKEIVEAISDPDAYRCVMAERAFLAELGGGCSIPCAAYATPIDSQNIWLRVLLGEPRGRKVARTEIRGKDPFEIGKAAARELLDEHGGAEIMEMVLM